MIRLPLNSISQKYFQLSTGVLWPRTWRGLSRCGTTHTRRQLKWVDDKDPTVTDVLELALARLKGPWFWPLQLVYNRLPLYPSTNLGLFVKAGIFCNLHRTSLIRELCMDPRLSRIKKHFFIQGDSKGKLAWNFLGLHCGSLQFWHPTYLCGVGRLTDQAHILDDQSTIYMVLFGI